MLISKRATSHRKLAVLIHLPFQLPFLGNKFNIRVLKIKIFVVIQNKYFKFQSQIFNETCRFAEWRSSKEHFFGFSGSAGRRQTLIQRHPSNTGYQQKHFTYVIYGWGLDCKSKKHNLFMKLTKGVNFISILPV